MLSNVLELTDEHDAIHAALRDEPVFAPPVPGEDAVAVEAAAATRIAAVRHGRAARTRRPSRDPPSPRGLSNAPAKSAKSMPRLEANGAPAEDAVASARSIPSARSLGSARSVGSAKGSVGSARSASSALEEKRGVSPRLVRPSVEDFRRLEQMAASMTAPQILAEIKRMTAEASPAPQHAQQHAPHAQRQQPLDRDSQNGHRGRNGQSSQSLPVAAVEGGGESAGSVAAAAAWAPQPAPLPHHPQERKVSTERSERSPASMPARRKDHAKDEHGGKKRVVAPTLRPTPTLRPMPTHVRGHASPPLLRRSAADEGELPDGDAEVAEVAELTEAAAEARVRAASALEATVKPVTPSSAASSAARAALGARGVASARMAAAPSQGGPPAVRRGPPSGGRPSPAGMMRLLPTAPDLSERTPTARHHRQDGVSSGLPSPARKPPSGGLRSGGGSSGGGTTGRRPGSPVSWRAPVADSPAEESPRTAAVKRAKAAAQGKRPSPGQEQGQHPRPAPALHRCSSTPLSGAGAAPMRPSEDALDPRSRH